MGIGFFSGSTFAHAQGWRGSALPSFYWRERASWPPTGG